MPRGPKANLHLTREVLLDRIHGHLAQVTQWSGMRDWGRAAEYSAKAEALIEVLEVDDCGSVGGFDRKRGQETQPRSLEERYRWLATVRITPAPVALLMGAATWCDENQQEALSGSLRAVVRGLEA